MRKILLLIVWLVSCWQIASAQTLQISGKVTAKEDGEALPFVPVGVKGTNQATATDINGTYKLNNVPVGSVLMFNAVGKKPVEVVVKSATVINVTLEEDVKEMKTVVITAQKLAKPRDQISSIEKISSEAIDKTVAPSFESSMQGRMAGVQVVQQGGTPGGGFQIRVRGVASLRSGAEPLYVLDGVPIITSSQGAAGVRANGLAEINPNDIESIEVLKDAASAAQYGSRAANGVVLITTKRGKSGASTFSFNYSRGVNIETNRLELLNGPEYQQTLKKSWDNYYLKEVVKPKPTAPPATPPLMLDNYQGFNQEVANRTNTDWLGYSMRPANLQEVNFSSSGGSEKTRFFFSGAYRDEQGILVGNDYKRGTTRLNVDHDASAKLKIGATSTISFTYTTYVPTTPSSGSNGAGGWGIAQTRSLPIYPIYSPDGREAYFNGFNPNFGGTNVIFSRNELKQQNTSLRTFNVVNASYELYKNLIFKTTLGFDLQNQLRTEYRSKAFLPVDAPNSQVGGGGSFTSTSNITTNINLNNTLSYKIDLGEDHKISTVLGQVIQNQNSSSVTSAGEGFSITYFKRATGNASQAAPRTTEFRFASFFGTANYKFKDRYLFQATVVRDATSRFPKNYRSGVFPALSAGWVISDEYFLKASRVITFLKVRTGWGIVGNANLGAGASEVDFPYITSVRNFGAYASFPGLDPASIGNDKLRWEQTQTIDFGLDFGIFNRVTGSIGIYTKDSRDLLLDMKIPQSSGYQNNSVLSNVGTMRNRGIEFSINTTNADLENSFKWNTDFNISFNRITLQSINADAGSLESDVSNSVPGGYLGTYYLPLWAGINPKTGDELIYEVDQREFDLTGKTVLTGRVITAPEDASLYNKHRYLIKDKSPFPIFYAGLTNNFAYKDFDLSILVYFNYGNWIYDKGEKTQSYISRAQSNLRRYMLKGWSQTDSTSQRPLVFDSYMATRESNRFLHNGSYIRLRNIQLGYTFPRVLLDRWNFTKGLTKLRFYISAQNILTFTNFIGWDPELFNSTANQGKEANLSPGVNNFEMPQVKSILGGINISF